MRSVKVKNQIIRECESIVDDRITSLYEPIIELVEGKFENKLSPITSAIDEVIGSNTDSLIEIGKTLELVDDFIGEENRRFNNEVKDELINLLQGQDLGEFVEEVVEELIHKLVTKCFIVNHVIMNKEVMMFKMKCASKLNVFVNMIMKDVNGKFYENLIDKVSSLVYYTQHILGDKTLEEYIESLEESEEETLEVEKRKMKKLFNSKDLEKFLKSEGFEEHRQGATSHKIYVNPETNKKVVLPQGRAIGFGLSHKIQKQATI